MYYPNLKTTDSELRALRHLTPAVKSKATPVFELTRSRKTSLSPAGSLARRAEQLIEAWGTEPFILDLCTEPSLMNDETIDMFDETNGYGNWRKFVSSNFGPGIIPCLLYVEDGSKHEFQDQVRWVSEKYKSVCIRTSVADEFASTLYDWALEVVDEEDIILCPVFYYLPKSEYPTTRAACVHYINTVVGNRPPAFLLFAGSSFPRSVLTMQGCLDHKGSFPAVEIELEDDLRRNFSNLDIRKADFASVHPLRYETKGGTWVPRIDFFEGDTFKYVRVRRAQGGYAAAALAIDTPSIAKLPKCWGTDQISLAKAGRVPGGSPSFWISVRINCWITKRAV